MKNRLFLVLLPLVLAALVGCAGEGEPVEVTRLVTEEVPVTVEVTRVVVQEVAMEVTRIVEVTATVEAPAEPTVEATAVVEPSPTPEPTATTAPVTGAAYTVQPGDTLATIADQTGTTVAELQAANNMDGSSFLIAGQEIIIPGLDGDVPVIEAPAPAATEAPAEAPAPAAVAASAPGTNLLPNPSFEGDWHFYLYNELQIPDGWQLATDEGPNNLEPGSGGLFNRPEVRVVPAKDLPPAEHGLFIFDGNKTVKAFKGGAPTSFSMFTDVALQPGSYRLTINFFPDTVTGYDDSRQKIYAWEPLSAEARVIVDNGGTGWQGTASGQRNTLTYDFTVDEARTVRVGGAFRNRYIMANNGWFLDAWSLTELDSAQ